MQWISVKEQEPPKDGTPFLGYDPSKEDEGKIYVLIFIPEKTLFYNDQLIREHYLEASGEGYFVWEPTYWMPLPEPPKDL